MNDIKNISIQTPIEWHNQIVITTALLAKVYETDVDNVKKNFSRHKDNFIEGTHYFLLQGENLREFKRVVTDSHLPIDDSLKFTSQLYLWTERGANRHCKILDTDKAWEQFDNLEETYFNKKQEVINRSQLSQSTQALFGLIESMARQELEQKRQAEQIAKVEEKVDTMKEIFTEPIFDWRSEINTRVREIAIKSGIEFKTLYNQMYGELEYTAHCSLKRLCSEKEKRMRNAGNTKSAIDKETSKIAIVEGKPQLKAIFENIVRKYAMKYCV